MIKKKSLTQPKINICDELLYVVNFELKLGNKIITDAELSDWPKIGSVFLSLQNDLQLKNYLLPSEIEYSICTDMHFGWHDECFCKKHGHLLVAGSTHFR